MRKFRVLNGYVLVEPIKEELVGDEGIVIAGGEMENIPFKGKVVAVGPDLKSQIKDGDIILYVSGHIPLTPIVFSPGLKGPEMVWVPEGCIVAIEG